MKTPLILLVLCLPIAAQEQVPLTERLSDGTKIVVIDGVEHRALPPAKVAELAKQKLDLDAALQKVDKRDAEIAVLNTQKELLIEKVSLIEAQRDNARRDLQDARVFIGQQKTLLDEETALRREQGQFIPHGNKTKFDKFLSLFDSKAMQFTIRGLIPIWTATRCQ